MASSRVPGGGEPEESQEAKEPYEPLNVLGRIREKGFGDGSRSSSSVGERESGAVSLPLPSVMPFPVARHRAEGPHWTSSRNVDHVPLPEDSDDLGPQALAALAKPLLRKKKPAVKLSRWKAQHAPNSDGDVKEQVNPPSPAEQSTQDVETKSTSGKDIIKRISDAEQQPRVTFTLPTAKIAEEVPAGGSEPHNYAEMSRLRSDSGASNRGKVTATGVEIARSGSELETIDAENRAAIASMSTAEVAEAQADLMNRLKPGVLDMLRKRGLKKVATEQREDKEGDGSEPTTTSGSLPYEKSQAINKKVQDFQDELSEANQEIMNSEEDLLETPAPRQEVSALTEEGSGWSKSWTERVEAVRLYRFDMEGNLVDLVAAPILKTSGTPPETQQMSSQNIAERDYLRSEGDPAAMGYTLREVADLVRSTVSGHRTVALRLITCVLENAILGLQNQEPTSSADPSQKVSKDVDWQAIWAYGLGPEPGLTLTLRLALDDTHTTVVVSCAKALHAFLSCSSNEALFDLRERWWSGSTAVFTAPIFRRHTKQDEGFIGGGHWKYNVKASELYPFGRTVSSQEDAEGKETVGDDATVASKDCAAGLIRMGLLPRIRYILEVEKLKAAEQPLLGVLIALARHSPAAADAVMKCPRLMEAVIQRFLQTHEDLDGGDRSARLSHNKAILLLKVLSEASRLNCTSFSDAGALQMAQSELYKPGFLLQARPRLRDSVCSTIVQSLHLWQVCIQYKMGISLFTDIYPTLCFWLSPLTVDEVFSNNNDDALCLAQDSYRTLERLAQTLPRLHADEGELSDRYDYVDEIWTWRVAVPLVETALGWLSTDLILAITETIKKSRHDEDDRAVKLIGTLASVLQFLATVSEKILVVENGVDSSRTPFIPTFVPRLGLLLATENFVGNENRGSTGGVQPRNRTSTLFESLCSLRNAKDEETGLAATCCLQAVVQLFHIIDQVIRTARDQSPLVTAVDGSTEAHKTLDFGLVDSSRNSFRSLLTHAGYEVIANSCLLQSMEVNGRGGPAPGLGLGWGALGGGAWSKRVLVAQATARLVAHLLEIVPLDTSGEKESDDSDSEFLNGRMKHGFGDKLKPHSSELMWRISCGFGIAALSGPEDWELVKQAFSKILLHPRTLSAMRETRENTMNDFDSLIGALGLSRDILSKFVTEEVSKVLLEHYIQIWVSKKKHKNVEDTNMRVILKGRESGSRLSTVQEDGRFDTQGNPRNNLVREWARQRLPLPSHWLLSPMATNITQVLFRLQGQEELGVSAVNGDEKEKMEEVVKSGLSWLLGVELLNHSTVRKWSSCFDSIPLVRKLHALSSVFVLGGDVFLQEEARTAVGVLQEFYGQHLDMSTTALQIKPDPQVEEQDEMYLHTRESLDFERGIDGNYTSFAESLGEQFGATSYGDVVFARQVALHFRQGVPDPIRLALWRAVADAQALRLLPTLAQCCGQPLGYLYPFEKNDEVVGAYVSAWTSGAFDTAVVQASLSYTLSLHHIAGFLFGLSDCVRDSLAIKKVARTLVRHSMRKSQQQAALINLIMYQPPPTTQNPHGKTSLQGKELEVRVTSLLEACEGIRTLLTQVERLQQLMNLAT